MFATNSEKRAIVTLVTHFEWHEVLKLAIIIHLCCRLCCVQCGISCCLLLVLLLLLLLAHFYISGIVGKGNLVTLRSTPPNYKRRKSEGETTTLCLGDLLCELF